MRGGLSIVVLDGSEFGLEVHYSRLLLAVGNW